MEANAGIKRKPQAGQPEAGKRQKTEVSYGDANEMEDDSGSNADVDQEQEISDMGEEDDENSEVDEDSLGFNKHSDEECDGEDDEDDEDDDDMEEFPWLKSINVHIKASDAADSPRVGYCTAKLIERDQIRANFHRDMEEPSNDTATVGFEVFDRWGCLKAEYQSHPVEKGTGIWGPELNHGRFLLIERMSIEEEYQRKGYGRQLFGQVWEKAQRLSTQDDDAWMAARRKRAQKLWKEIRIDDEPPKEFDDGYIDRMDQILEPGQKVVTGCDFAIVWATVLDTRETSAEANELSPAEKELYYQKKQTALEHYWRAMGFRRIGSSPYFCLAKDAEHASHLLRPQDDHVRPAILAFSAREDGQDFPLIDPIPDPNVFEQKRLNDIETKELLESRLHSHPATDPGWLSVDRHGNSILHFLARDCKAEALTWLLALPFADSLRSVRNLEGETPLEVLETQLETDRTFKEVGLARVVTADLFSGFAANQVECLKQLKGLKNASPTDISRLAFGCTCGHCLGGFLSPRVAHALESQGEINHDMLNQALDYTTSGDDWCDDWDHMFEHLPRSVKSNLRTKKSMRQGFTNLLSYIALTLQAKMVPTSDKVLQIQLLGSNEWPPYTRNYLQRGGTVLAVLQACFDRAIDEDQYLGDGNHHLTFQSDIGALPACRNDGEFVFARQQCRRLEGLPDEVAPQIGMGRVW